jgi:rubredoxin
MLWTCPQCGAAVDASADYCWGCKQPRPEADFGSRTASEPVSKRDREVAPANDVSETAPPSGSGWPLSPPSEMSATRSWTCSKCGETVDAGFLVCWSCGTSIEGVEDPSFVVGDKSTVGDDESEAVSFLDDDALDEPIEGSAPRYCVRCQGPLEPGFIADFQHGSSVMKPSEWVAGTPQPSFWTGTWTGDQRYPIQAFRCRHCGYLEFRAGEPADDT